MAFCPPSVTQGAPSGPIMTPWGAAPLPRSTSLNEPSRGSSRPSLPLRWPVNQIVPSGAGVTSCGPVAPATGPHDVTPAPDGTIWFTGQRNGKLGRLDPRDGSFKLVDLGKGAAPHNVIIGPDGAPWVTEGGQNAIARVDPGDHKVT